MIESIKIVCVKVLAIIELVIPYTRVQKYSWIFFFCFSWVDPILKGHKLNLTNSLTDQNLKFSPHMILMSSLTTPHMSSLDYITGLLKYCEMEEEGQKLAYPTMKLK